MQPDNLQATLLAGDCYLRLGENGNAVQTVEPLAERFPDQLALQYILGTALIRDHQAEKGREIIAHILKHGQNAGVSMLRAEMALSDENYSEAKKYAVEASVEDPTIAESFMVEGIAQEGLGDYTGACNSLEKSLQIDPEGFDSNLHMGALMLRDQELDPARDFTQRALHLRPNSAAALYQMGLVDKAMSKLLDAVDQFEAFTEVAGAACAIGITLLSSEAPARRIA